MLEIGRVHAGFPSLPNQRLKPVDRKPGSGTDYVPVFRERLNRNGLRKFRST